LETLTVFVGPNGSGKSNFVDALSFVQECLAGSIELAFKNRGGIKAVRRISAGHPTHVGVRVTVDLDAERWSDYAFEIAAKPGERFSVSRERCVVRHRPLLGEEEQYEFEIRNGEFSKPIPGVRPRVAKDRLALFAGSATDEFRPVYDFLTSMRFYSIAPNRLRELQEPDPGDHLKRDGSNAAAVLKRLQDEEKPDTYERVCRMLSRVTEGVTGVEYRAIGQKETLQFHQDVGLKYPWNFDALNMSDGTLRILGLLLAIYQPGQASVIAIEEPECTIHPGAAELILELLLDAAKDRQILLTTHSPDLLDSKSLSDRQLRTVVMRKGNTLIGPIASSSKTAIREELYSPGELLRANELDLDLAAVETASEQLNLFGAAAEPPAS
jgi:predicted ATPase